MHWIVDRIEGDTVVVETAPDRTQTLPLSALPYGVTEGVVLSVTIDPVLTRMRRDRARRQLSRLVRRPPLPR